MNTLVAPDPPRKFPCWCRAIYSWGGENKGDLGFVEGDLIECLNVGDGLWWCGRLRRDMRVRGMFPSNFVTVLDQSFQPAPRALSPSPTRTPSPSPTPIGLTRSKPFRKPFQSYTAPDTAAQKRAELRQQTFVAAPRTPSPAPRGRKLRGQSPKPNSRRAPPSFPSVNPFAPYDDATDAGDYTTEIFSLDGDHGSPPPPPPPHRSQYRAGISTGFREHREEHSNGFQRPRSLSPEQDTPEPTGHTPSPLTSAIEAVISELGDMSVMTKEKEKPEPLPLITPEEYMEGPELTVLARDIAPSPEGIHMGCWTEEVRNEGFVDPITGEVHPPRDRHLRSRLNTPLRPNTSIGIEHGKTRANHKRSRTDFTEEPPQLSNYVERMESRLGRIKRAVTPLAADPYSADDMSDHEDAPPVPPKKYFRPKSPWGRPKSPWGRPKSPFGRSKSPSGSPKSPFGSWRRPKSPFSRSKSPDMPPPLPNHPRSKSSVGGYGEPPFLRHKKSAFEAGKALIGRTFTTKSSSTNASAGVQSTTTNGTTSTQVTDKSLMSGKSAGAYSATSAGSYARKYGRAQSAMGSRKEVDDGRPETPFTGATYHSSHATDAPRSLSQAGWRGDSQDITPKAKHKRSGFFKRMVESAKTGAASARSTIAVGEIRDSQGSFNTTVPPVPKIPSGLTGIAGGFGNHYGMQQTKAKETAREMGLSTSGIDWVAVRRDVNRSNSLSKHEREERKERCKIMNYPARAPVAELHAAVAGGQDGQHQPVLNPFTFQESSLKLVDKNVRFVNNFPSVKSAMSLVMDYVCRPYRTDIQRLRAIFTFCAEKIAWEDFYDGDVDTTRVIQSKRGGTEEIVFLVFEMCEAINIPCNVIRGYLKLPGEILAVGRTPPRTHFWNAVLVENEWRIMDCSLASPSHPKRGLFSEAPDGIAEFFYFLTRPSEICWTHVPSHPNDQHLVPPVNPEILLSLPVACPPFFQHELQMVDFDTSLTHIEELEMIHIKFFVPTEVECVARTESFELAADSDGDFYETEKVVKMAALCQVSWVDGRKQYTVKAIPPPRSSGLCILKVYAGPRGLITSPKNHPHPMAFALPVVHKGDERTDYEFVSRYPTPQASTNDLYIIQPQCRRLVSGHTFVFAVRQNSSSIKLTEEALNEAAGAPTLDGVRTPIPYVRPTSSMSASSTSASGTGSSAAPLLAGGREKTKPSKLAIQGPGGKILRLRRRDERLGSASGGNSEAAASGGVYETTIKCGEKGIWRGLVLADRGLRWCVFAEWKCV